MAQIIVFLSDKEENILINIKKKYNLKKMSKSDVIKNLLLGNFKV